MKTRQQAEIKHCWFFIIIIISGGFYIPWTMNV